jgi:hypothetical protein
MNAILADVARRIQTCVSLETCFEYDTRNPLIDLVHQNCTHVLNAHTLDLLDNSSTIGRASDVLVGFYLPGGASKLTLEIGGQTIWEGRGFKEGRFVYAVDDESVVPLICLRLHEVKVTVQGANGGVRAIFLTLDTFHRRTLMGWVRGPRRPDGSEVRYHSGMCRISDRDPHNDEFAIALPNMRHIPLVFDAAVWPRTITDAIMVPLVAAGLLEMHDGHIRCTHRPALCALPDATLEALDRAIAPFLDGLHVVGNQGVLGCTDAGMHEHRDEVYQEGGEMAVLLYLTNVDEGGETVFDASNSAIRGAKYEVRPSIGRAVLFDPRAVHHARPVTQGHKVVLTVELFRKAQAKLPTAVPKDPRVLSTARLG